MEVKCKGISMLVWRMWEAIAGPDADLDLIDSTLSQLCSLTRSQWLVSALKRSSPRRVLPSHLC